MAILLSLVIGCLCASDIHMSLHRSVAEVVFALLLTVIVVGFGVQTFTTVLSGRTYRVFGSEDLAQMTSTGQLPEKRG